MADCNCIRGESEYNFKIEWNDKDSFLYQDLSNWNTDYGYSVPDEYDIIITPPNSKKDYKIAVNTKCWTKIGKEELGSDFKDGIYCIKLYNCDNIYTKYFAITNKLDCCYEKMLLNDEDDFAKMRELIDKIKVAAKFGDFKLAKDLVKNANSVALNNNCNC